MKSTNISSRWRTWPYSVDLTHGTTNYGYKKGQYLVVRDGDAPNKKFSIASHGDGELGNDNFHVYLMAELAHTKIAQLDDIQSGNTAAPI